MDFKTMFTQSMCLFAMVISTATLGSEAIRLSEPISETNAYEIFGSLPKHQGSSISLTKIVKQAEKHHDQLVRITTNVSKVCQRKGCFFIAVEGDIWARIVFEDYSFLFHEFFENIFVGTPSIYGHPGGAYMPFFERGGMPLLTGL